MTSSSSKTSTIYIDFEGVWPDIVEMAVAVVECGAITQFQSQIVDTSTIQDMVKHNRTARFCHCIPFSIVQWEGITLEGLRQWFRDCLEECNYPLTIRGYGDDITFGSLVKVFPFLTDYYIDYSQVPLPPWSVRTSAAYHQTKVALKRENVFSLICPAHNHSLPYTVSKHKPVTNTVKAKLSHDYHCALYDVLELVFYDYPPIMLSYSDFNA